MPLNPCGFFLHRLLHRQYCFLETRGGWTNTLAQLTPLSPSIYNLANFQYHHYQTRPPEMKKLNQKPYYENNELRDPLSKWLHQQNKQKTLQLHTCLHSIDRYDKSANLFFISRKKLLLHLRRLLISGRSSLLLIAFAPKRLRESRSSQSPPCGLHLMLREGGGKESLKKIFSLSTKLFT
jgi:hypothetical protein